ncbi:hypothetical protein GCM10018791_27720 [Streptomyces zaomyceticus]|nr:hypothetical protein GCM10018791_27720 [Streptomyces zaomyceticus]
MTTRIGDGGVLMRVSPGGVVVVRCGQAVWSYGPIRRNAPAVRSGGPFRRKARAVSATGPS